MNFLMQVAGLVAHRGAHVRLDEARGDGVDRHAAAGQLHRQRPREGVDRPLAGRVVRLARVHVLGRDARNIDDPAAPPLHHGEGHGLAEVEDAAEVRLDTLFQSSGSMRTNRSSSITPGVVHQNVEPAPAPARRLNARLDGVEVGHVGLDGEGRSARLRRSPPTSVSAAAWLPR